MKQITIIAILSICTIGAIAQNESNKKQRLDFAKTYFEIGGTFWPSFTGKQLIDNEIHDFNNPSSAMQYLNWGGFHFWGHAEFYVSIPLNYQAFQKNEGAGAELLHSVSTGARFLPWAYEEKKIRPYVGLSWSALDFKQILQSNEDQPVLSKDFMLTYDAGLLYGQGNFSLRLGMHYFSDNTWDYPLSRTLKSKIKSPNLALQLGLIYAMDLSKRGDQEVLEEWNDYPRLSKLSLDTKRFGAFFIGAGPSLSYSLKRSVYNEQNLPYLKDKLTSSNYFDIALGYHFQKLGFFTALSFRNPEFVTEGFGAKQSIKKTSLAFEINKYLVDYSGFVPYVGLNIAYDKLKYSEQVDEQSTELAFQSIEPGITFGWDILPGKTSEALILRTNLRWYPFASFDLANRKFDFSQLEYDLIQVVFYPERLKSKKKSGGKLYH